MSENVTQANAGGSPAAGGVLPPCAFRPAGPPRSARGVVVFLARARYGHPAHARLPRRLRWDGTRARASTASVIKPAKDGFPPAASTSAPAAALQTSSWPAGAVV